MKKYKWLLSLLFVVSFFVGAFSIPLSTRSMIWGPQIDQDVNAEDDGLNVVKTFIWVDGSIAWSEFTFQTLGSGKGIRKELVDSAKFAQRNHAKKWLDVYKKNKY